MENLKPETWQPGTLSFALRVANWLLLGRSEPSSKFMAGVALNGSGYRSQWHDPTPHDAADLGRCVQLLQAVPEVRTAAFATLREVNAVWRVYVEHWDELTAIWRVGDLNKTNAKLKELRQSVVSGPLSVAGEPTPGPSEEGNLKPFVSASSQPGELTAQLL